MAAPDGSRAADLRPRPTTDDGTLTRERHRLACGSPSRAPGRRPGGVTLRFSDRCPVPDGDGDLRFRAAPWWSTRSPAWRRPTDRADRLGPRSTADDGTLTRERHRLACGSPSRAPGRRPGGVTLGFSDRCPVPDGDGDIRFRTARGGRRDLQRGARRRGLGALPAHCHAATPRLSGLPGAVLSDQGVGQHEKACAGRRPTGRADRPGPRSTADDGTLTRERHRLACGSPSRAPGRRPGGVTLGFSDRCPVPDGDGDIRFRTARGGRRDLQRGARRRGLGALPAHCHAPAPRLSGLPGAVLSDQGVGQHEKACAGRRPTGRADRPGPRSTADDGTLTRERHRLACGSPSRAPGRRPGGVTLGFSGRCPVPDGDGDIRFRTARGSTRSPAWRASAWTRRTSRPLPRRHAPVVRSSPGRFCPTRALASTRSLCMAAPDGSSRPTWPPFNGRRRNADAGAASPRLRLAFPRPRSQTGGSDVGVQ